MSTRVDLGKNSWYEFHQIVPEEIQMDALMFEHIWNLHPEDYGTVKIYGKDIKTPRWQQTYGKDYKFSGINHEALPITDPYLQKLNEWVNNNSGLLFNQLLINWYQDGNHYIGKHSDNEKQLVPNSPIYSFSFGQNRDFRIISKDNSLKPIKINLPSNSLIIMGGEMQTHFYHEVPKRALSNCPNRRINITFRLFL